MSDKIIFLVGMMGSGKSSVAPHLARLLNLPWQDMDTLFEQREKTTIAKYFEQYGQEAFREKEAALLLDIIAEGKPLVLATGGGTPCFNDNMAAMKQAGHTVYLYAPPGVLARRLSGGTPKDGSKNGANVPAKAKPAAKRPMLTLAEGTTLPQHLENLVHQREQWYNQAEMQVNTALGSPAELASLIVGLL